MSRPDDNNSLEKNWGFDLSYLVEWDQTGAAPPPINDQNRPLVLAALESILLDFRRREEYLAALKSLCPQGFAHLDALDESLEEQLLNHGLEVATNDQLAQLLLRPVGLCQLADAIRDAFAEAWWPAMRRVGSRLMDEHGVSVPKLSDVMPALAFDPLADMPLSVPLDAGAVAPSPVVPLVQRQMQLAKSRQLWPLEPLGNREAWKDDILRSNEPVAVRATALETAPSDSPPKARRLTGALQRVADSPMVLRWTGNLPAGFELMGLALTRLQPCGRQPLTIPPRTFATLLRAIANRPSPAAGDAVQPERAAAALGLALSAASAEDRPGSRETETHQGEEGEVVDFSVECNPQRGTVGVRARMPAGVRDDFAVCDVHYTDRGGQPATERRLLRLRASESASSAWSVPQRVALPTPDDCGSAELGFQFRSLRDDDLYLLSAGDLDLLQAEQPALLLPAKKNDAGGFEFAARLPFEREALAAADVAWSLQVARIEKEPADA